MSSKLSTEVQHSLANFSVVMEDCVELNMFTFEGENFRGDGTRGRKKSNANAAAVIPFQLTLPQRERRKNYESGDFILEELSNPTLVRLLYPNLEDYSMLQLLLF
jgi:hypothetical protein